MSFPSIDLTKLSPLCVDLDGTLIYEDVIWIALRKLFKKNMLKGLYSLFCLFKGRAFFKQELAKMVEIDPKKLSYNTWFLAFLTAYKETGGHLVLATATDIRFANTIADYLNIFDEVIASEGTKNLRAANKGKILCERFGEKRFSYAGNSYDDLKVWPYAKYAIAVNLSYKASLFNLYKKIDFWKKF
jgi:phosphoserine phosphatase